MARNLKKDDDEDGGLDSLLDTMTNVVGILVLVLIVTQLGVSDALTEIAANSQASEDSIAEAQAQLAALSLEKEELAEQTTSLAGFDIDAERERLNRLKQKLEAQKRLLEDQSKQANEFSLNIERDRQAAAKNKKEIEDTKQKRQQLQTDIEKALELRAEIQAKLDRTPRRAAAPPKEVTIPNPRPAPEGSQQAIIICAGNRLYPVVLKPIRDDLVARSKNLIVQRRLNRDPEAGIDPEAFGELYSKLRYTKDPFFDVELFVAGKRWPQVRLKPKEGRGGSEEELRRSNSRIRTILAGLDPQKYWVRFYVLPDSFDVYLTARRVLADAGVLAGWEPQSENWVYTAGIGGGIELGPPRPPNPNPPPARPSKPANVID